MYQQPVYNYTQNLHFIWDEIMLPITYGSDVEAAREMLKGSAEEYTRDMLAEARKDVEATSPSLLLPPIHLEPAVFTEVTSNFVALTLRYVVDPRNAGRFAPRCSEDCSRWFGTMIASTSDPRRWI